MADVQRGDEDAFAVLVHRYETPLYGYLRRMACNSADAEELFQEAFLRVFQHAHRFELDCPFKPWLYRIATNLCRDQQRFWKRRPTRPLDAPAGPEADGPPLAESVPAPNAAADGPAREAEMRARLEAAIAALPAKHRAVFLMARYEDMPYEEIGATLGIPTGTVKSRMNKAVKRLLEQLKDE